jgi:CHRD domain
MPRLLCLLALATFVPALRADLFFDATLLPGNEVPPHATPAFGFITVDLHADMTTLDVAETFNNLTAVATAAHIHCCAPAGTNASVVLPFVGFPTTVSGTYTHTFNLNTDLTGITPAAFIAGLQTGNTYANIHNAPFPGGEIRGQLTAVPEPHSVVVLGGCLLALALFRRRFA